MNVKDFNFNELKNVTFHKKTKKQIEFSTKKENIKEDFNNFEYISYNTAYEKKIIFHINLMRILMIKEFFLINIYHNS